MTNAVVRVPELEDAEVVKLINGPEAFTPDGEFILGPSEVRGLLGRGRVLRARARRRGRDGPARRRVARRGDSRASTSGRWTRAASARNYADPRVHACPHDRGLLDLLRRQVPGPRAAGRPADARLAGVQAAGASSAPPSARNPAGSARTGSSRTRRRATSRCGRAAGPGELWSPAIGAEHGACRERGGDLRRDLLREDRGLRAGRRRVPREPLRQPGRSRRRARSSTPRCSTRAAGSSATSRSRGSTRISSGSSRAPPSASTTSPGSRSHCWTRAVRVDGRDRRDLACLGLWGPAAREILQPLPRTSSRVPVHARPRARGRPVAVPGRCASPTWASSAGSSTAERSRGSSSGTRSGMRAAPTGSSPAATRRSTRCGSRRATGSGARTSHPRTRRTRQASASR